MDKPSMDSEAARLLKTEERSRIVSEAMGRWILYGEVPPGFRIEQGVLVRDIKDCDKAEIARYFGVSEKLI